MYPYLIILRERVCHIKIKLITCIGLFTPSRHLLTNIYISLFNYSIVTKGGVTYLAISNYTGTSLFLAEVPLKHTPLFDYFIVIKDIVIYLTIINYIDSHP